MSPAAARLDASFRDPSGFVFTRDGVLYRQVNAVFADEYEACTAAGLYEALGRDRLLIPHRPADLALALTPDAHAVLAPERVPFISYPYEWCFGELRDAALLTLDVQVRALEHGFTLRDASAYNVQFVDGRPVFIDTLSFGRYRDGEPWLAYKQFCEHFLVPLTLMAERDVRCGQLLREYIDGIPLDLGSALLPRRSWLDVRTLLHVHLHARSQRKHHESKVSAVVGTRRIEKPALLALIGTLRSAIQRLDWRPAGTQWADYVGATNYSDAAESAKRALVGEYLRRVNPATVWDVGANTGEYSRVARDVAPLVCSFDIDPAAVERNYRTVRARGETGILPLTLDLTNPSPSIGWANRERMSLAERGPADAVLALALVHHLAIGNNVPLDHVARYFAELGRTLVIEFVAKEDSQVQRLLRNRADVFPSYTRDGFEQAFGAHFATEACARVGDAERWLYLFRTRTPDHTTTG
ncbi:50S ribosomal protein L11 methyltransferase [Gemmatimonadetes bacterium T265]|nr:50S ribosomal protein L11 methyltransferase [Gemmatimonadetes bacterium T265]